MSTTLTNGLKLPDKGSVDWYADMQNNYAILDGAVGTIAEHTEALAEKAPLAHTHTKSDITDFPAYGNAAGTICEGNDSRLSDARTPVAHTHGKSDVTDLFNSANVWTGDNTFNKPIQIQKTTGDTEIEIRNQQVDVTNNTASAVDDIRFFDKNGKITGGVRLAYDGTKVSQRVYARSYSSDGISNTNVALELKSDLQNSIKEATISSNLLPATNNSYDLGSSSYQWNNLYAKNYYLKSASAELGITGGFSAIKFQDKNNKNLAGITLGHYSAGKLSYDRFSIYDKNSNNQEVEEFVELGFLVSNQQFYFRPSANNKAYLGTSNTKWKDLYTNLINGEKPGSLGLPSMTSSQATDVDITDWYIQDPDFPDDPTKKIIDDSVEQTVSSSFPGWLWIQFENVSGNYAYARQTQAITNMCNERIADGLATDVFPTIHFVFPIINSLKVRIRSKSATVRIFPCLGNV